MKISQNMRDVEVRDLMKLKFNLCDNCKNDMRKECKFYKKHYYTFESDKE